MPDNNENKKELTLEDIYKLLSDVKALLNSFIETYINNKKDEDNDNSSCDCNK